jgi:hypothetical protein
VEKSGSGGNLSSSESEFLRKISKPKGRQGMDVATDYEAHDTFIGLSRDGRRYRGEEMVACG